MVRISDVPGLTQVARGVTPTAVLRINDTPLDDLPELSPDDPGYNRRKELRVRITAQNNANAYERYDKIMGLSTGLFGSIYNACRKTDPVFAKHLYSSCDYRRLGHDGGWFDGRLAFDMLHAKLFGIKRTKADVEFYDAAKDIQKRNKLPDGCKLSDFKAKASHDAAGFAQALIDQNKGRRPHVQIGLRARPTTRAFNTFPTTFSTNAARSVNGESSDTITLLSHPLHRVARR